MMLEITSTQNPRVKHVLALQQKSRQRNKEGLFVVEGLREVERAVQAGYQPQELWYSIESEAVLNLAQKADQPIKCSSAVFNKICYRAANADVLATFKIQHIHLSDISLGNNPLLVVLEGVEKPGNLGAILRTCTGLGADAVVVCDTAVDIHNPNVIRNSLGAFFDLPIIEASSADAIAYFKEKGLEICTAHLGASKSYTEVDFTKPCALVFGAEDKGLTDQWVINTNQHIIIPMSGIVDSLNVSVSVAVMLAEAVRQRGNKKAPK